MNHGTPDAGRAHNDAGTKLAVAVSDPVLDLAVRSLASADGFRVSDLAEADLLITTGTVPGGFAGKVVLVVPDAGVPCRASVDRVLRAEAAAAVAMSDLDKLGMVLAAVDQSVAVLTPTVLQRARDVPEITDRQLRLLGLVAEGRSTAASADALGISRATVKREVARLCAAFGVRKRQELVAVARRVRAED